MTTQPMTGHVRTRETHSLTSSGGCWPGPDGWPIPERELVPDGPVIRVSEELLAKRSAGKSKVQEEGRCRLCGRSAAEPDDWEPGDIRMMTRHHLVPRWWWNQYPTLRALYCHVDANIVPLCRGCHDLIESVEHGPEYRRMLRHVLTQAEIAFVIQVRGKAWLEKQFPLRSPLASAHVVR